MILSMVVQELDLKINIYLPFVSLFSIQTVPDLFLASRRR